MSAATTGKAAEEASPGTATSAARSRATPRTETPCSVRSTGTPNRGSMRSV